MRYTVKKMGQAAMDLIFPPACPLCNELLTNKAAKICDRCKKMISYVGETRCLKCGKEVSSDEKEYCYDCEKSKRSFVRGYPVMKYQPPVTGAMMAFKYHGKKQYGDFFASEIVRCYGREFLSLDIDIITSVPVHRKRLKKRGYNQAAVIADLVSYYTGIGVDNSLLVRNKNTLPQKKLNDIERANNIKNAFICPDKIVKYKKILLVDDIYTTGVTIESCSQALLDAGANEIYYTSVCIGAGGEGVI